MRFLQLVKFKKTQFWLGEPCMYFRWRRPGKKIKVCRTWNFSRVWNRPWFLKTLISQDLDFQKSGCRLKGWQLVKFFLNTNLLWGTLYVLQTEEVTIRQHLEILATWRCRIVAAELSTPWMVKSVKYRCTRPYTSMM